MYKRQILGTCLITLSLNIAAGAIFSQEKPAKPGYAIAVKEGAEGGAPAAKPAEEPMEAMMVSASVEKGQAIAKQCQACHTFEKGGPNKIGPNLWGIVGSPRGEDRGGFNFSAAMKAKGGTWTFGELYAFLENPRGYIPGTAMTFAGPVSYTHLLRVRFGSKISKRSRIEVITEGVFTRLILDDPSLEGVAAVLFDEFHERSLDADLGLALARDVQLALREDLKILVMSATLDGARVAALLGNAPVVESQGRRCV